jgi:hypothetical protein
MEKRRIALALVVCATLSGVASVAIADEPASASHQARKKKKSSKPAAVKASFACKTDADCAFTTYADGGCCPSLCQPRAVAKTSADALERYAAACAKPNGRECPELSCAAPSSARVPACVSGKCVARAAPTPGRE